MCIYLSIHKALGKKQEMDNFLEIGMLASRVGGVNRKRNFSEYLFALLECWSMC